MQNVRAQNATGFLQEAQETGVQGGEGDREAWEESGQRLAEEHRGFGSKSSGAFFQQQDAVHRRLRNLSTAQVQGSCLFTNGASPRSWGAPPLRFPRMVLIQPDRTGRVPSFPRGRLMQQREKNEPVAQDHGHSLEKRVHEIRRPQPFGLLLAQRHGPFPAGCRFLHQAEFFGVAAMNL